ncbi:hypothetical protein FACS189423_05290 [Bacteroidia bacterium]|nr:hypothetical protein FACS189423_05290 [Bacteroidia bacterium]
MLSIESYIESDTLLYQVGELRPGFLDKDTASFKGPSPENSLGLNTYESLDNGSGCPNTFKLVSKTHPTTGEILFVVE